MITKKAYLNVDVDEQIENVFGFLNIFPLKKSKSTGERSMSIEKLFYSHLSNVFELLYFLNFNIAKIKNNLTLLIFRFL